MSLVSLMSQADIGRLIRHHPHTTTMNYLKVAKEALREHQNSEYSLATEATKATEGDPGEPLPPEGDPRRVPLEIIDAVWAAGGWLVITGDRIRGVLRHGAPSEPLTPGLLARVERHQAELLCVLPRIPSAQDRQPQQPGRHPSCGCSDWRTPIPARR